MKLTIHREALGIGGGCVELSSEKTRILIDFGMPPADGKREPFDTKLLEGKTVAELKGSGLLPNIQGLYNDEPRGVDAILISRSSRDYYGLLGYVNPDIPVYMSCGIKALIDASNIFIHNRPGRIHAQIIKGRRPFKIGDLTVTPYLADDSGAGAQAFLIEAGGKRLFYSGDIRGHGKKGVLFRTIFERPPENIDCLLLGGAMRGTDEQAYKNEAAVKRRIEEILRANVSIVLICCSSQDIDRLASAYRACQKAGRTFVIDLHTAFILSKLGKDSAGLPQPDGKNVRIKFVNTQAESLKDAGYRDLLFVYNKSKIEFFKINEEKHKMLMLVRDTGSFPVIPKELEETKGAKLIYSMCEKSLTGEFRASCDRRGIEIEQVHTCGSDTIDDLKAFVEVLKPKTLLPMDAFGPEQYSEAFAGADVKVLQEGRTFTL
ncbi:MAG TPA: MBL fold metallo-hydrolase [bacterium]|nr:MBL fold metallo-hydrolase [bacterium]